MRRKLGPVLSATRQTVWLASCLHSPKGSAESYSTVSGNVLRSEESVFHKSSSSANKALLLDILESTPTRRDTKSYIYNFGNNKPKTVTDTKPKAHLTHGVNLGELYHKFQASVPGPGIALPQDVDGSLEAPQAIHVSLVKIRAPESLSAEVINGIGRTLSQLATLGMVSVVIVSPHRFPREAAIRAGFIAEQISRIEIAVQESGEARAQKIDHLLEVSTAEYGNGADLSNITSSHVTISNSNMLYTLLRRGVVPIIGPIGTSVLPSNSTVELDANDIIRALVLELSKKQEHKGVGSKTMHHDRLVSLDRIIVLDPLGGTPSADRKHGSHVYINIEQEFEDIDGYLKHQELSSQSADAGIHAQNLVVLRDALARLPPSSSGLIATPQEVARSATQIVEDSTGSRVRTRRQKNPLIHNLLTDKPAVSSSLPHDRTSAPAAGGTTSTFVKRGMPLAIMPDANRGPWDARPTTHILSLSDSEIDLTRLVALVEASFRRKLNVEDYFSRLESCLAGVIIAGDYEGCALCTRESVPDFPDMKVPYLDKFAVLPQSQGTGVGVADILFQAMVRTCFPSGVCWRSRADNPVNKWYFERAQGTWKLPGNKWTTFWTKEDPSHDELLAYEAVCKSVTPSWAD